MTDTFDTRTKREIATGILNEMFEGRERVAIADIVAAGHEQDVSRNTLARAAKDLGLRQIHNGRCGGFWQKQD